MDVKLLLVDDEEEFVDALAERLDARGFDVAVAYRGPTAIESIAQASTNRGFDVVVLDLRMPGMNGLDVMKKVKQSGNHTQFIILTGHGSESDRDEALRLGAYTFLLKPVEINTLIDNINDACRAFGQKLPEGETP